MNDLVDWRNSRVAHLAFKEILEEAPKYPGTRCKLPFFLNW
jgi:hypothetical protein